MKTRLRGVLSMFVVLLAGSVFAGLLIKGLNQQAVLASGAINILYVNSDGSCPAPCYTHPQLAVDAAADGDVVKIAGTGIYTQTYLRNGHEQIIYISKTLSLIAGYDGNFTEPPNFMMPINLQPITNTRAVYIDNNASVTLQYFNFVSANGPAGAALYVDHADLTLQGGRFMNNSGPSCSAIQMNDGLLILEESEFYLNISPGNGAALCVDNAQEGSLIRKATFSNNISASGSAMLLSNSKIKIERTMLMENSALSGTAGAMIFSGGIYTLTNNVFRRNYAAMGSTIMSANTATVTLLHNTFNGDYYTQELIGLSSGGSLFMLNNILVNAPVGVVVTDSWLTADHNIFYAISEAASLTGTGQITLTNVYTDDPGFTSAMQFWIDSNSFAEGKALDIGLVIDYEGAFRPINLLPDLGAIEAPLPFEVDSTLDYSAFFEDPGGLTTTLIISAGATQNDMIFHYTPMVEPGYYFTETLYAGRAFELSPGETLLKQLNYLPLIMRPSSAAASSPLWPFTFPSLQPDRASSFIFIKPVLVILDYRDEDLLGIDENSLLLYYYDEDQKAWLDVAQTCFPPSSYTRDTLANRLSVYICHLSRFGMGGKGN